MNEENESALIGQMYAAAQGAVDWGLCRARHSPHYAESRTMPSRSRMPLHPLHSTTLSPF